jgi:hypothetical protein
MSAWPGGQGRVPLITHHESIMGSIPVGGSRNSPTGHEFEHILLTVNTETQCSKTVATTQSGTRAFQSGFFIFLYLQMSPRSDVTTGPIRLKCWHQHR